MAQTFNNNNFSEKVLKSPLPVGVYFWAEWCPPCRMAKPVINELAKEFEGKMVVGKIDVDKSQELAQKYSVMSVPTLIFFKGGKEVERIVGFPGKAGYLEKIKNLL